MRTGTLLRFLLLLGLLGQTLPAQGDRLLTLEDLYHPRKKLSFEGNPPAIRGWMKDGRHYLRRDADSDERPRRLMRIHAVSGEAQPLYDVEALSQAFLKLSGFNARRTDKLIRNGEFRLSPDEQGVLIQHRRDLLYYHFEQKRAVQLTNSEALELVPTFSPDGRFVAFIQGYDLYVVDVEKGKTRRLTRGGHEDLRNGLLDWVYQEEIYGRGGFKGYWWSPDSSRLVYLQLDESSVPEFTVVDHIPLHLRTEVTRYPKAGDPNPQVRLGVVSVTGGRTGWLDLSPYSPQDLLIVRVGWDGTGRRVVFQAQNKNQTWLDLNFANPNSGRVRRVLRETTSAWVNVLAQPYWLRDGTFLWQSERSGWRHLYHYAAAGTLLGPVTSGEWEVRSLHGIDEKTGWVYFSGTERSPLGLDVYRVPVAGGDLERLSRREGTHSVLFNPQWTHYVDRWSDLTTPLQVRLFESPGRQVRVIYEDPGRSLADFRLSPPQRLRVPARDGFLMDAILIRPSDFDPSKRYPVLAHTYGGPQAPRVRNSWGGKSYLWHQMLAQMGYVVWICDNRSASRQGAQASWPIHKNLGALELRDIEDGLAWLKDKPWIDSDRIGLWGWSYGGFMTSYALTHSDSFRMGIAGAPVTDWALYDTIYTERYMGTPQENPEGYSASSVVKAAANLKGKLLIIHGSMDDNVHMQNTLRLVHELQKSGKQFDLMIYPRTRHGVRASDRVYHLRRMMTDYIQENL